MTTSDTMPNDGLGGFPPPAPAADRRLLRRNKTNRVAAGVCSGLGDYFRLDPVLFRVLFATAAFFGGAGILAYLLAWAAIPEAGTAHAPIDGLIGWLRRHRFPVWLAAAVAGLILWAVAFSWWAPGPFFPVLAVAVLLVVFFARREMQASPADAPPATDAPEATAGISAPVDLSKEAAETTAPAWVRDGHSWFREARNAARERRRRSWPIRAAILAALFVTLIALAIADALTGVQLRVYFFVLLGIVGLGLAVGLVLRRFPISMTMLLVPAVAGVVAFGGSSASLHDGVGQREWQPTGIPAGDYRLAFGQATLDLTSLPQPAAARTIHVTMAAGQLRIIAPATLNMTVLANVHFGQIKVDGFDAHYDGAGLSHVIDPPPGAQGTPITVDVHLADGQVSVTHR